MRHFNRFAGVLLGALICGFLVPTAWGQNFEQFKKSSLYTDFKAKRVGDIVTIMIVESTSGSQTSDRESSGKGDTKGSGSITGNLTGFLPTLGAQTSFEHGNSGKAGSNQKDALTGRITAVVTAVTPNGNLVLQGKRQMEVNGESYLLGVEGTARQKDITSENTVFSYNLANVRISYKKDGFINKLGKPSVVARWTTWLMLAGLGASAALGIGAAAN